MATRYDRKVHYFASTASSTITRQATSRLSLNLLRCLSVRRKVTPTAIRPSSPLQSADTRMKYTRTLEVTQFATGGHLARTRLSCMHKIPLMNGTGKCSDNEVVHGVNSAVDAICYRSIVVAGG